MPHDSPLIALLSIGFGLAFVFGALATRLKLSPLVGYLVAGVVIGPFTPGFTADADLASEVAEIGVILLMFGVGLHFSPKDLLSVRAVAVPVALLQIVLSSALGIGLALWLGWGIETGVVLGLALSVSSTVVALRSLQERRLMQTERGKLKRDLFMKEIADMTSKIVERAKSYQSDTVPIDDLTKKVAKEINDLTA